LCYNLPMHENISIGVDIEEISRFKNKSVEKDAIFLDKIFTKNEIDYAYSKNNFAQHLCVRYCAKEAIVKALSEFKIDDVFYSDIEITNLKNGQPVAKIKKYPNIEIKISLSHSKTYAVANVILFK